MNNPQEVVVEEEPQEVVEQDEENKGKQEVVGEQEEEPQEVVGEKLVGTGKKGKKEKKGKKGTKRTKRNTIESLNRVKQENILNKMKDIFKQPSNYQFTLPIMLSKDRSLLQNEIISNEIKNRTVDINNPEFFKLKAGGPQRIVSTPVYKQSVDDYITLENINNNIKNLDKKTYESLNNKPIQFFKTYYKPENELIEKIKNKLHKLQENSVNDGEIETPVPDQENRQDSVNEGEIETPVPDQVVVNFYNDYMTKRGDIDKHKEQTQALVSYYNTVINKAVMNEAIKNGIDAYRKTNDIPPIDATTDVVIKRGMIPKVRKNAELANAIIAQKEFVEKRNKSSSFGRGGGERKTKKAKKSRQTKKAKKAKNIRKSQKHK